MGRIRTVPDHWTVWAFADIHGVASGFETALREAGLIDAALHWTAPPGTALVGCGDYVDRGSGNRRVTALLRRLEQEAPAAGGLVVPARGNHDHLLSTLAEGTNDDLATWMRYGGQATLDDFGLPVPSPADPAATLRAMDQAQPGFLAWLAQLPHAVRWRDVLFVHGGLPPWAGLDDLGTQTEQHLYVRREWFTTAWETGVFSRFEEAGILRVVFGHTPRPDGAELFQDGRSIDIDTNACGNPHMPDDARRLVTLLELRDDVPFADAHRVVVDTRDAPDGTRPQHARNP
jgi:hypothetical protein